MPVYQYEGQYFDLPDGLSKEQAIAKIETHLGKSAPQQQEAPATQAPQQQQQRSMLGEIGRQVGLTGRAAYEAFTAPATAALEFGRSAANVGANLLGLEGRVPSVAEAQSRMLTQAGLPTAETGIERAVQAGTQAMASTAGMAAAAPKVPALAADLVRQIPAAGAAGVTGQASAEAVKELTGSDAAATLAGIGLGALAAGATGRAAGAIAGEKPQLYTMQQVKQRASRAYNSMDEAGVTLKPQSALNMVSDIRTKLDDARMVQGTDQAKEVNARLDQITKMIGTTRVSFTELEKMRGMLNDLKASKDADVQRLGKVAVDQVDNYISNLSGRDIIAGKAGLDDAVKNVVNARKDWRNASRSSILEDALNVAEARALDPKASESELIRRGFINLAANKDKMRLFSDNEQNLIKSVAKGGSLDPLLSFLSRFNPERPGIALLGTAGIAAGNPALAAGVAGGGFLADRLQAQLRRQAAEQASRTIASGAARAPQTNLAYRGLLTGGLLPPEPGQ